MAGFVNKFAKEIFILCFFFLVGFHEKENLVVGDDTSRSECTSYTSSSDLDIITKTFVTDSSNTLKLVWTGDNDDTFLIVMVNDKQKPSQVYRSNDGGKSIVNQTSILNNYTVTNVIVNPNNRSRVILLASEPFRAQTTLFTSVDGGEKYVQGRTPFSIRDQIYLHPSNPDYFLALGSEESQWKAFFSPDFGTTWKPLLSYVKRVTWSSGISDSNDTIYLLVGEKNNFGGNNQNYTLKKTVNLGNNFAVLARNVTSFEHHDKFLFVTAKTNEENPKSILRVSTSSGKRWNEVQLPSFRTDEFYKVVDSSDGMVFIHVNTKSVEGPGTLYTSDADGIIFAESLRQHLYTNDPQVADFYRVWSMRGVYITNQLSKQGSRGVHAMITFNRGGTWERIKVPEGISCHPTNQTCSLQVAYKYSETKRIPQGPLSVEAAVGLIIVHGYVATSVLESPPDVFLSSDGGYTWRKILNGPHKYVITDHGGILAAVPMSSNYTNIMKVSINEGNDWACVNLMSDRVIVRNILTDPRSRSLKVIVISQSPSLSEWHLTVVDFKKYLARECTDSDLEEFLPHQGHSRNKTFDGCLLGLRQIFKKIKKGIRCFLGSDRAIKIKEESCVCSKDDYECDYGYFRPNGKDSECEENPKYKNSELDVCVDGEEVEIRTTGYRKIPGDRCVGGWNPVDFHKTDLKVKCKEGDKRLLANLYKYPDNNMKNAVIAIIVMTVVVTVLIMAVYFIKKVQQLNKFTPSYRYSRLNQDDSGNPDDSKHAGNGQLAFDMSGDEDEQDSPESPATLVVPSQTVTDKHNWSIQERKASTATTPNSETGLGDQSLRNLLDDTDDELLH